MKKYIEKAQSTRKKKHTEKQIEKHSQLEKGKQKRNTLKRYIENTVKGENDTKKKHIENHLGQLKTQVK